MGRREHAQAKPVAAMLRVRRRCRDRHRPFGPGARPDHERACDRNLGLVAIAAQGAAAGARTAAAHPEPADALRRHSAVEAIRPRVGGLAEGSAGIHPRYVDQAPPALVLLQSSQQHRHPERGVGLRRLARRPDGLAVRHLQARGDRLHLAATLCAGRDARHVAAARPVSGIDPHARTGVRPVPLQGVRAAHSVPPARRRRLREPGRQPDDPEHVRGRHDQGLAKLAGRAVLQRSR